VRYGLDLPVTMAALAKSRPIFHSEADFQQSLGWEIRRQHPEALVRAEVRPRRRIRLVLMITLDGERTAIELKYIPQRFTGAVDAEVYELPGQAPRDLAR
jgi:hypothetical protein